jgi:hypothetical protein
MFGLPSKRAATSTTRPGSRIRFVALAGLAITPLIAASLVFAQADPTGPPRIRTPGWDCACTHVLFKDYFNTPSDAWTFVNREGSIKGGQLVIDGDYLPDPPERGGTAFTHVGDRTWRDYVYSVTFDNKNVGGDPGEVHESELFARVVDTSHGGLGTHYRILIWSPGGEDPAGQGHDMSKGLVGLMRYNDGVGVGLKHRYFSNVVVGSNQATVQVQGNVITVRVNGVRVIRAKDPEPLRYGGVGVGQIWETNGRFDNVLVVERIR